MVSLQGVLSIRSIEGSRGRFNVGRLVTDLGDFVVKDPVLDQYEAGKYDGMFGITRIMPSYYTHGGRIVVEMRAVVETMALVDIDLTSTPDEELPEPDPVDDSQATAHKASLESHSHETGADLVAEVVTDGTNSDEMLFALVWPLREQVKLDPTIGRDQLRAQCKRLGELGYRFQPIGQIWIRDPVV